VENYYEFASMINRETRNSKGQLHSLNDEPAIIFQSGTKCWCKDGEYHRDNDEPAIIDPNGTKYWYKDGKCHRDNDEPAFIGSDGTKYWYINGMKLAKKQIELLKKINDSEIQHLPWLLNEDELLNFLIEKRMSE
jgi:hypothetical protein